MVHEIARLVIDPARAAAFEAAVGECAALFRDAGGCRSMRLEREVEDRAVYRLVVGWDRVEDHMVGFRNSPAFAEWRATVGPFFVEPPAVSHVEQAAAYF